MGISLVIVILGMSLICFAASIWRFDRSGKTSNETSIILNLLAIFWVAIATVDLLCILYSEL